MSSLLNADREAVADALRDPEPQNPQNTVLRVIALLLFAIIAVGGAYLYFERPVAVIIQQR
jgi:hypothetical protein